MQRLARGWTRTLIALSYYWKASRPRGMRTKKRRRESPDFAAEGDKDAEPTADEREGSARDISQLREAPLSVSAATAADAPPPTVLVLVGLPGAGKSTLFAALDRRWPGRYCRVCQDILKSRPKCEKAAREALIQGLTPVIDRTNVDTKQRESWLRIAAEAGVEAHAVFFNVSPALCMQRVKERTEHFGSEAKPFIVNMMKGRLRAPDAAEGFAKVEAVSTPEEVAAFVSEVGGKRSKNDAAAAAAAVATPAPEALPGGR